MCYLTYSRIFLFFFIHLDVTVNVKRECDDSEEGAPQAKKHCPDDEEINAQVQNAIDSILNLQKSDPALDEAVRSILTS